MHLSMHMKAGLLAILAAVALGCTTSGTLDYIPKRPVVESTQTTYNGPTPNGGGSSCPPRSASGACPFERIQCSFDDRGCEVCTCSPP